MWLAVSHCVAIAGALALPIDSLARAAIIVAIICHASLRCAAPTATIVATADGLWALPQRQLTTLRLSASTRYADGWVDLRLHGDRGDIAILLLRDQLGGEDWRRLLAQLRAARHDGGLS